MREAGRRAADELEERLAPLLNVTEEDLRMLLD